MASKFFITALSVVALGVIGFMVLQTYENMDVSSQEVAEATLYKSPSCGCCGQYTAYLRQEGYNVDIENVADMSAIKAQYGVPYELESCHTMEIAGYVVEGHVPEEAIQKLLLEKPDIKGIGMGGMPSGSPGMPGPKTSDFVIYEILRDGTRGSVFMTL